MEGLLGFIIFSILVACWVRAKRSATRMRSQNGGKAKEPFWPVVGPGISELLQLLVSAGVVRTSTWGKLKPADLRSIQGNLLMALLLSILPSHRFHVGG